MKIKILSFSLSLILALTAVLVIYRYVQVNLQEVMVVAAKDNLPSHTKITAQMVELKKVPASGVHPRTLTTVDSVINKYTASPLIKGEVFLNSMVASAEALPKGYLHRLPAHQRVMAVGTDLTKSVGGTVKPGDLVDLIVVLEDKNSGVNTVKTFLRQLEVVDVRDTNAKGMEEPKQKEDDQIINTNQKKVPSAVLLAVSNQQAEQIALYDKLGEISMIINPAQIQPTSTSNSPITTSLN